MSWSYVPGGGGGGGGKALIFEAAKVSFRVPRRNTELREEKQKSNFLFNLFLRVKICLSHAQIGLL